jgi:hypothetical protein
MLQIDLPFDLPTSIQTMALIWGMTAHMVGDWMLQTDWMATNKMNLRHPAGWVHSGIHLALMLLIFPLPAALFVACTHLLIDTRVPVRWWMTNIKRIPSGSPAMLYLDIWMDQVFHVVIMVIAVLLFF